MREILFFYIMFIVVGNSKVLAEPNTVQGNRELVSAILNKMPESTTNESKIVFGIKEQFYLIVVNDTIGTEYFVTIDTQNKNFELIPVKFNDNGNSRGSVAKYFANIQYLDEPNQGKIGSKFQAGYPAYFAFINGNCIIKDMIFDSISIPSPLPIDLLVFLNEEIIREIRLWYRQL